MTVYRVSGSIAELDTVSTDGREIVGDGLELPSQVIPLMLLGAPGGSAHEGAELVGMLNAGMTREDDGTLLTATGEVWDTDKVPPGEYECGVDLAGYELETVELSSGSVARVLSSKLVAVTLYGPDSGQHAAFARARLTVEVPE